MPPLSPEIELITTASLRLIKELLKKIFAVHMPNSQKDSSQNTTSKDLDNSMKHSSS